MAERRPRNGHGYNHHHGSLGLDLSKGSLPVIIVVTLLASVGVGAYNIGSILTQMQSDKKSADDKFVSIDQELRTIRELLQGAGYINSSDLERWCGLTESLNKGWHCPPAQFRASR